MTFNWFYKLFSFVMKQRPPFVTMKKFIPHPLSCSAPPSRKHLLSEGVYVEYYGVDMILTTEDPPMRIDLSGPAFDALYDYVAHFAPGARP